VRWVHNTLPFQVAWTFWWEIGDHPAHQWKARDNLELAQKRFQKFHKFFQEKIHQEKKKTDKFLKSKLEIMAY